jgi:hypothetical protein
MPVRLLLFIFSIITFVIFFLRTKLEDLGFDVMVLFAGNLLMFLVTLVVSWFHKKGANNANPNAFIRSVYAGTMIKMFIVMIGVMVYAFVMKPVNKPSIITCLLFYALYTVVEVRFAMKIVKESGK